mmetsp:Transcript_17357/g.46858  ORF Transcript_17357/g.46858 Transcript_17357/m.46858 type:complete len:230 (+) Transcript_17357:471-1160(+)
MVVAICDKVSNRCQNKSMLLGKLFEFRHARHREAVRRYHLAQGPTRLQPREQHEVHSRLSVPLSRHRAIVACSQWEDMPWPVEGTWATRGVGKLGQRVCPISGGDSRRCAFFGVHRDGEGGALGVLVLAHHGGQLELVDAVPWHGCANYSRGVAHHEGNGSVRGVLCCHNQVTLVFAILVVGDEDEFAAAQGMHGVHNRLLPKATFASGCGHSTWSRLSRDPPSLGREH